MGGHHRARWHIENIAWQNQISSIGSGAPSLFPGIISGVVKAGVSGSHRPLDPVCSSM
jgi:hypothetical protein